MQGRLCRAVPQHVTHSTRTTAHTRHHTTVSTGSCESRAALSIKTVYFSRFGASWRGVCRHMSGAVCVVRSYVHALHVVGAEIGAVRADIGTVECGYRSMVHPHAGGVRGAF